MLQKKCLEEKEEKGGRGCGKSIKKAGKRGGGRYTLAN